MLLTGWTKTALAQQADTTQTEKELRLRQKTIQKTYHSERSTNHYLSGNGSYQVPEPKQYYVPPFTGQKTLDLAVAAYRREVSESRFFRILHKIAPYIYNRFEFGVYKINDLPIIGRDNPLFQSYQSKAKRQ